ncbi:MAG: CARDB domain-containing protein, partial [Campylobacterales bacterium]
KVVKNPMYCDDGLILDMGFNATNKEIDLGTDKYGYYRIEGYCLPYSSTDEEIVITPFKVEKEDIKTITKYTNYPLTVTVTDENGNPVKDVLVIGHVELWKKSYDQWMGKEYITTAITDDTGKATLYIQTKDFDDGKIEIFVSNKTYLFKVGENYFDIEGMPTTYTDLKGSLSYKIINSTENSTTFEITLTVTNEGNVDSGEFNTTIYANNKPIKTERLSLKAGESKTMTVTYTTNSTDEIMLISQRQINAVENTITNIEEAFEPLLDQELEIFSFHLNEAVKEISSITRPFENDEMLDKMFGSFCLGK